MQKFSSLLLALIACAGTIFAEIVQIDDLYYNLNADNKTAEVTFQEWYSKTNYSYLTAVNIPESVEYNSVTYSVTSIGNDAFARCSSLTSIEIPNSVTSIQYGAFYECSGLTSVTIGNSVTSIGYDAFYECSGLTSIEIPNSVTSIGDYAFYHVPNIVYSGSATGSPWGAKSVNGYVDGYLVYSDNTKTTLLACSSSAEGEIVIPNSVTSIGHRAFAYCSSLTSVTIPNSVTSIGYWAFEYCTGLTSVTIGNSVTSIGYDAFANCSGLTSIEIPNSVTSIGGSAFYGCSGLTSIEIPNSVTSIESGAFDGCSGLTSVTIPNSVTSIGWGAFRFCSGLTSIEIPNSVTSIGNYAFASCTGLTSIVVASGNTTYDSRENCNAIIETATNALIKGCKSTIIPNSVTSIGDLAFSDCTGLTSIEIPNSVTYIGQYAFYDCSGLTSVTNYATTPQTINSNVFDGVDLSSCTLNVPEGSIGLYQAANGWKDFTNIQAITDEPTSIGETTYNQSQITNKIIKNNQIFILTGDKTYTVTGQQLK